MFTANDISNKLPLLVIFLCKIATFGYAIDVTYAASTPLNQRTCTKSANISITFKQWLWISWSKVLKILHRNILISIIVFERNWIYVFYEHNVYKHTEAQISKKRSIF